MLYKGEKTKAVITGIELKQLLACIAHSSTCFRFRLLGEMWMKNLMRVVNVADHTATFYDEVDGKYFLIRINNIMQFEIDQRFRNYQPYFHYEVKPSPEIE